MLGFLSSLALAYFLAATTVSAQVAINDYGVDCTFPIHGKDLTCDHVFADDRKQAYEDFMEGCRQTYGRKANRCDSTEEDRIRMSLRQPQSMVNYTDTGYKKIRAPKEVMELLYAHYERNKVEQKEEVWPAGNVYVNHWESPTYMIQMRSKLAACTGRQADKL